MSLVFPSSPAVGDEYVDSGGTAWIWDGVKWTTQAGLASQGGYLPLSGGTLTGPLQLNADPTTPLEAATKEYVDDNVIAVTVADAAPLSPRNGALWFDSMSCQLYVSYQDPSSQQWVVAVNGIAALSNYLPLIGGTLTGDLTVEATLAIDGSATASGTGYLTINGAPTKGQDIVGSVGGLNRWLIALGNGAAETGSNVGSDFGIYNYNDAGAMLSAALSIERSTGTVTMTGLNSDGTGLLLQRASGPAYIQFDAPVGSGMGVWSTRGSSQRWEIDLGNNTAESGSNAGSDFVITSYNDAGAYLATPLFINRATGTVSMSAVNLGTTASQSTAINVAGTLGQSPPGPMLVAAPNANDCFISFVVSGSFGAQFGLSANSYFYQGGWSYGNGAVYNIWTSRDFANPACDYRIKADVAPLRSTWDHIKALKPISYRQKETGALRAPADARPIIEADDRERWGFIAHELQETLGETASTGVRDDPDLLQAPNMMMLVAALTKTMQEMQLRIEELEAAR